MPNKKVVYSTSIGNPYNSSVKPSTKREHTTKRKRKK